MSHLCAECGLEHADPVIAEAPVAETAAADVQIAEIEAERDIRLAQIGAKAGESDAITRIAELEGKMDGMREMLERLLPPEPEPDPTPVIVDAPAAEPEPVVEEPAATPPPAVESEPKRSRQRNAWWG